MSDELEIESGDRVEALREIHPTVPLGSVGTVILISRDPPRGPKLKISVAWDSGPKTGLAFWTNPQSEGWAGTLRVVSRPK